MIRVLIVEDEPLAVVKLKGMVEKLFNDLLVVGETDSVESTLNWLAQNTNPDLIFMDIHLGDGLCFNIFEKTKLDCPVIFTTAYDHYAIKAFKTNSIDYLLKPIEEEELKGAIEKFKRLQNGAKQPVFETQMIDAVKRALFAKEYKDRFIVKVGEHIRIIPINEVLYFFSFQKGTFLRTKQGKNYLLELSLEKLEEQVDPKIYFRINRKYMVCLDGISDIISVSSSRLKLKMPLQEEDDLVVSRERISEFRTWLEGK